MAGEQDVPWWGRARNLVWSLGPVTVAFFLILFVLLGWVPSPMLRAIEDGVRGLNDNRTILQSIQAEVSRHANESREGAVSQLRALRQICRNTAKNGTQNERCDDMDR